jgi:hypothetical protein
MDTRQHFDRLRVAENERVRRAGRRANLEYLNHVCTLSAKCPMKRRVIGVRVFLAERGYESSLVNRIILNAEGYHEGTIVRT